MKNFLLLSSLVYLWTTSYAQQNSIPLCNRAEDSNIALPISLVVQSKEQPARRGTIDVKVRAVTLDNTAINHTLKVIYTSSCNGLADTIALLRLKTYLTKGANIPLTIPLIYLSANLPFHYQKAKIILVDKNNKVASYASIYLHFTPYQTVELWSESDFDNLPRIWASPTPDGEPSRRWIAKKNIPTTNLTLAELSNDSIAKSYLSIPGLAYTQTS